MKLVDQSTSDMKLDESRTPSYDFNLNEYTTDDVQTFGPMPGKR